MGKRILIVGPRMAIGGTERHLAFVLPELVKMGYEVHAHLLEREGELESCLIEAGVHVQGGRSGGSRIFRAVRTVVDLARRIRRLRPEIVHSFLPEPSLLAAISIALVGNKMLIVSRRSLSRYRSGYFMMTELEKWVCKKSTVLIGNSTAVLGELLDDCGNPAKVGLIFNGASVFPPQDITKRTEVRARIGVSEDCYLIVVVANLFLYKGHIDLVRALIMVKDVLPEKWLAVFVGRDMGQGGAVDEEARSGGISQHLLCVGQRMDAAEILGSADLSVLPSHEEGFSNALIEGMAAGVPSIATEVGGNIDAIENGVSGFLVPVADPATLARALARLATDRVLSAMMGEAGRERVSRLFTKDKVLNQYQKLYDGIGNLGEKTTTEILEDAVD